MAYRFDRQIRRFRRLSAALLMAGALTTTLSSGISAAEDDVVATVDGKPITESDLTFAMGEFGQQLQRIPAERQRKLILNVLIDMSLLANAGEKSGMESDPDYINRMRFLKRRSLRDAYFIKNIQDTVTEADIRAAYEEEAAALTGKEEIRARHILVKSEEEAKAIIAELDGGADFAELAKSKSTGPSGPKGGDLGFFGEGQMVPPFEKAALALTPGSHSKEPVKTQFGYHVIKVEEKRAAEPPKFEQISASLRDRLVREKFTEAVADLKKDAKIEILKPQTATEKGGDDGETKKDE